MGIAAQSTKRTVIRLTMVSALVIVPLAAACGGGDAAGPKRSVTVGDLQQERYFYQGNYLGHIVMVSAAVSAVLGSRAFELSSGDSSDDPLPVVIGQPVTVGTGQMVRVTGIVGQLHFTAPAEHVPYIQDDLYAKDETKTYLYDTTVEPLPATQQGTRGRPRGDPALAQLARWVNDEIVDPATRCRLAVLAPDLIGTRARDPRITLTVMACCPRAALAVRPHSRDVRQALRRTEARLSRWEDPRTRPWARWRGLGWEPEALAVTSAIRVAMKHTHRFRGPRHDEQLRELLERAVADCRTLLAQHPTAPQHSRPSITTAGTGSATTTQARPASSRSRMTLSRAPSARSTDPARTPPGP